MTQSSQPRINAIAFGSGREPDAVYVVVGLGLLGRAVAWHFRRLLGDASLVTKTMRLDWGELIAPGEQVLNLVREYGARRIELIWCAGKAGFAATDEELYHEFSFFEKLVTSLFERYGSELVVSLLSSAGGLYEGTLFVTDITQVAPRRSYGTWKLKQESLLGEMGVAARIYRLSSVYGFLVPRQRMGLLNVLLERALTGDEAQIYAKPTTLRDYVFNMDVARYVVNCALDNRRPAIQVLASGRPTSVDALIKLISLVTNKRIKVRYSGRNENADNIVFARHLIPGDFMVSPLEETVLLLAARKQGGVEETQDMGFRMDGGSSFATK